MLTLLLLPLLHATADVHHSQDIFFQSRDAPLYIWLRMRTNDHRGELLDKLDQWFIQLMGDDDGVELPMDQITEHQVQMLFFLLLRKCRHAPVL
jgi:hypothetical protein